jgi:DNA invertase Pin-like site-specific DNA recombinase
MQIIVSKEAGLIMTVYGYARVSTRDQDLIAQDAELMAAGCAKVFKEKISGAKTDRPELAKVIRRLEPGDVLLVTRLDRLARFLNGPELAAEDLAASQHHAI